MVFGMEITGILQSKAFLMLTRLVLLVIENPTLAIVF